MKKALAMILTLVMLMGCFTGCGNNSEETTAAQTEAKTEAQAQATEAVNDTTEAETEAWLGTEDGKSITLHFWGGVQPEYGYDELVANFNEEYKDRGLQVEYTRYVNDTEGNLQLETYLMGGGEIDMFMGYGGRARLDARSESNLLLDMSDMLAERGFDLVTELGAANMADYLYDDGSVYGFPTKYENGRWLLVNTDMFKEAGVEVPYDGWTHSEFLAAIEKLTHGEGQDKVYGVSYTLKQSNAGIVGIMGSVLGSNFVYKDTDATQINYDSDVWRAGFEMVKTSLDNGWAIPIEDEYSENLTVANTFLAGKCAITTNVSQMRLCMDTATYPHDFTTALVPGPVPDDEQYQTEYYRTHAAVTGAGDLFCIAANTAYPEQCMEFALWYVQGGMSPLAKGGRIPLWTGLDKSLVIDVLRANAEGAIDMQSMENYLSIDNTKGVKSIVSSVESEIGDVFREEFEAMCYGRQSVDETITNLVTRATALVEGAK